MLLTFIFYSWHTQWAQLHFLQAVAVYFSSQIANIDTCLRLTPLGLPLNLFPVVSRFFDVCFKIVVLFFFICFELRLAVTRRSLEHTVEKKRGWLQNILLHHDLEADFKEVGYSWRYWLGNWMPGGIILLTYATGGGRRWHWLIEVFQFCILSAVRWRASAQSHADVF